MSIEVMKQAHKLAMLLECLLLTSLPSQRFWDEAMAALGEYSSSMNAIHEQRAPTHMGQPVTEAPIISATPLSRF